MAQPKTPEARQLLQEHLALLKQNRVHSLMLTQLMEQQRINSQELRKALRSLDKDRAVWLEGYVSGLDEFNKILQGIEKSSMAVEEPQLPQY